LRPAHPLRRWAPLWSELQHAVHRRGRERAEVNDVGKTVNIVPVRVVEATPTATAAAPASMGRMEIVLVGGERIIVGADVDATALARIVKALARR
jgi:transposase